MGTAEAQDCFASSETKVLRKPDNKNRKTAPRIYVEAALLSVVISLAIENFSGSRLASVEHNASSAEGSPSPLGCKNTNISGMDKTKGGKSSAGQRFPTEYINV